MASEPTPTLAEEHAALERRLEESISTTVARHAGAATAAKPELCGDLADIARAYAGAVQARALADMAASVGELVTLARAHLGDPEPGTARRPRKAGT